MTHSAHQSPSAISDTVDPRVNQRAASNPRTSVWVNASAGSGKTTVLTARVTRLLLAGVVPQKILCLTYTRAGAAEMSNRITARFSKWASCSEDEIREDLDNLQDTAPSDHQIKEARRLFARVLACPGGLRIRTIHSFCQEVLSRFPLEAGLPPHFALIDEQELDVMRNSVLDDMLREAADDPTVDIGKALTHLVQAQGEHGFKKMLHDVVRERGRLRQALLKAGDKENLRIEIRHLLGLEADTSVEHIRETTMDLIPVDAMRQLAGWMAQGSKTYVERARILMDILAQTGMDRSRLFNDYRSLFLTAENEPRKVFGNKDILTRYPDIPEMCLGEAERMLRATERLESAEIAELTDAVVVFGLAFAERLDARKAARAALDYDDLIMFTDQLLSREGIAPWILYKLDNGIDHILVDEAQDTSRAQWNIVQALSQEFYAGEGHRPDTNRTLFVVGDEKQSIFSFQNADPEAFLGLREFFSERLEEAGRTLERVALHTSFRSAPAVLKAVDIIFENDAVRTGVSPEPVSHNASPNHDGSLKVGRVEVWPLLQPIKDEAKSDGTWVIPTGYEDEHDPQAELAQQIAQKIAGWIARKTKLPGSPRAIVPGDIMILLRRRGRFADLMVRALKSNDVAVTGVDRMRLINQLPVMDLLSMARFALLPEDDLNLATLLRSPFFGLSEEDLMTLAISRTATLWDSLKTHRDLNDHFARTIDYLDARLREADFSTPFAFLSHVLQAPCPANQISGRQALWSRLGDEALDPIDELLNEAQSFIAHHSPSLQNFLHWLTQADAEIKRELDRGNQQGGGQVRIMTVHASKGLEAPIVFLPDTASVPRATDIPKFQWSEDGVPLFLIRRPQFSTARRLWQTARNRQMEEYRRLFYVALTRAASNLYICGWQGAHPTQDLAESWYNLALNALRPLHKEHLEDNEEIPAPLIIHGDPIVTIASKPEITASIGPTASLPAWASTAVPASTPDPVILSLPTEDVISAATPDAAFTRGRIIHRVLQSLPEIDEPKRLTAIRRFLAHPRHHLDDAQQHEIELEVQDLLQRKEFQGLFGADSVAEVALTGALNGVDVFRRVDRLCLRGNEVWVLDYKTNRPPPLELKDVPLPYRRQMSEYRALLSAIYPDKLIRCFLLWTYAPHLMELE